jgi:protein-disulfide isomerase
MTQLIPPVSIIDNSYGNPAALIELVEFGDYECPYCGRAYPIVKNIQKILGSDLKFVFRNFPLRKIHPNAFPAALATEAAARQNRFWEMHDIIFENQRSLDADKFIQFGVILGLDPDRFKTDMQDQVLMAKVSKDFESGLRSGVNRTPTFFINGIKYEDHWSDYHLLEHLRSVLGELSVK